METSTIPAFEAKFEDIRIYASNLQIQKVTDVLLSVFSEISPYTSIWHNMTINLTTQIKTLNGNVFIIFRNQSEDNRMAIFLEGRFFAEGNVQLRSANIFAKLIQYLFVWTLNYVKENEVLDKDAKLFTMPSYLYSQDQFETVFSE